MKNLYVACELGAANGRVMLGAVQKEGLLVSEAAHFQDLTTEQDGEVQWDVARIFQEVMGAVRGIAAQEEPIRGISFHSRENDALLFEANGSLVTPSTRASEAAATAQLKKLLAKVPIQELYAETGVQPSAISMACQLAAESSRRLKKASHALSLADGFNFLFSGIARAECSQAQQGQLYSALTKSWSERLVKAAGLPSKILPPVVPAGSKLGEVRRELASQAGLEDAMVTTTCSHTLAASLAALTIADPEPWAFLLPDDSAVLGTRLESASINDVSREMKYSNLLGFQNCVGFYKHWTGLKLVDECHRAWSQQDRGMDNEVLMHLATSATPFQALIDPANPRFSSADDMPQEIQAFCRETGQEPPRKPGPILRCILESLALHYRKGLVELEYIAGTSFNRLYVLSDRSNILLNHFLANAMQLPVVIMPPETAAVGNVAIQALALGHIASAEQAQDLVRHSIKTHTINPHATTWTEVYDRFLALNPV
jgi:rhamnulokinase